MKKLLLLSLAGTLSAGAMAQSASNGSVVFNHSQHTPKAGDKGPHVTNMPTKKTGATATTANKTTAMVDRWFSYYDWVDEVSGGTLNENSFLMSIWFDSTILVNYTSGPGPVNYSSVMQVMDPVSNDQIFDDVAIFPDEADLTASAPYTVDSVNVFGSYVRNVNRPGNIVDTLIFSVAPSTGAYRLSKATYPELAPYLDANHDTLVAFTQLNVDSAGRALFADGGGPAAITWKVPITVEQGDTADAQGQVSVNAWTYPVPNGGLNMPAGGRFAMSVTFKSGDTWTPNVDSLNGMHRFLPLVGETGDGVQMPYYYYEVNDKNMTGLMFSTDTTFYEPSILIEAFNTVGFYQEFAAFDAHLKWEPTSVKNVAADFSAVAVPNPANSSVNIPVSMKSNGTVTVTLQNTMGQTIATQNLGTVAAGQKAVATFNTAALASGMYFYTVEANGQRATSRVVVAH